MTTITKVDSRYGAPMGRVEHGNDPGKLYLRRVRVDGGGAYWGLGQPFYEAYDGEGFTCYRRGPDRNAVKEQLRREHDTADFRLKFYR